MNKQVAAIVALQDASPDVRALAEKIVEAVISIAAEAPAYQAAEASFRAAGMIGLMCSTPGRGSNALKKGSGLLQTMSGNVTVFEVIQ